MDHEASRTALSAVRPDLAEDEVRRAVSILEGQVVGDEWRNMFGDPEEFSGFPLGMLEGEARYALWFHALMMNGMGEDVYEHEVEAEDDDDLELDVLCMDPPNCEFELNELDKKLFPELKDKTKITYATTNDGFWVELSNEEIDQ